MGLNHNCLKELDFEYLEIGMYGKQRKIRCNVCGNVWSEDAQANKSVTGEDKDAIHDEM